MISTMGLPTADGPSPGFGGRVGFELQFAVGETVEGAPVPAGEAVDQAAKLLVTKQRSRPERDTRLGGELLCRWLLMLETMSDVA
jgi:hypothetical protein